MFNCLNFSFSFFWSESQLFSSSPGVAKLENEILVCLMNARQKRKKISTQKERIFCSFWVKKFTSVFETQWEPQQRKFLRRSLTLSETNFHVRAITHSTDQRTVKKRTCARAVNILQIHNAITLWICKIPLIILGYILNGTGRNFLLWRQNKLDCFLLVLSCIFLFRLLGGTFCSQIAFA